MQKHRNGLFSFVKSSRKVAYKISALRRFPGFLFSFLFPKENSVADWKGIKDVFFNSEFRVVEGVFWVRKKKVWEAFKTRTKVI